MMSMKPAMIQPIATYITTTPFESFSGNDCTSTMSSGISCAAATCPKTWLTT
jgi:hypothetical protein